MPARGDHEARRRDVSEAVWHVLADRGFGGLTLRAVAAAMDASTGLLTHYFPTKRALLRYALEVAEERTDERSRRVPAEEGLPALRAALLDVLPLTEETSAMSRVWVSFWDGALGDPALAARQQARYERWRAALSTHINAARRAGHLPSPETAHRGADDGGMGEGGTGEGGTGLGRAGLGGTDLRGAEPGRAGDGGTGEGRAGLGGADLGGADPGRADPGSTDLRRADPGRTDLRRADLGGTDLRGAEPGGTDDGETDDGGTRDGRAGLGGADLGQADLGEADLSGADPGSTELRGADRGRTDLGGAEPGGAEPGGTDLRRAGLGGAGSSGGPASVDLAATCAAFAHGLVVQALFAPDDFPPDRQIRLLDAFLAGLGGPGSRT